MKTAPVDQPNNPPAAAAGQPLNLFVKGLNWVGDAIMATPALARLRRAYPQARITLMVRPWVAAVYEHNPDVDQLWVHDDATSLSAFWKAVRMIRGGRFTIGLALPNSFRAAALLYLGQIRYRYGFRRHRRGWLLNRGVEPDAELLEGHQVFYYLRLIEELSGKSADPVKLVLNPGQIEREEIRRLLAQRGLDRGRPLIGLAPGSINSNAKRWPADRFAAVGERLAEKTGAEILLLGSMKEKDVMDRVAARSKVPMHAVGEELNLAQLIALIERLSGMICNDSGAMHLGAALRVPTVAIFGPTTHTNTYPYSPSAVVVRKADVECAPCELRECPIDHRCMTGVTPEEVFEAFKKVVKESRKTQAKPK